MRNNKKILGNQSIPDNNHVSKIKRTFPIFILFIGVLLRYSSLPKIVSYLLISTALSLVIFAYISNKRFIDVPKKLLIIISVVFILYTFHMIRLSNLYQLTRVPFFILVLFINIFIIPNVIKEELLIYVISIVFGTTIILTLPAAVIGEYRIGPLIILDGYVGLSGFFNPNGFGMIGAIGAISSYSVFRQNYSTTSKILFMFIFVACTLGTLLSRSRLATLLIVLGMIAYFVGFNYDVQVQATIIVGVIILLSSFFVFALIQPDSNIVRFVLEYDRPILWRSSVQAISERPLLGYGFGQAPKAIGRFYESKAPHNGFLNFALQTGIIGVSVLVIYIGSLAKALFFSDSINPATGALFFIMVSTMFFESNIPIGIGIFPLMLQLLFGYIWIDYINKM